MRIFCTTSDKYLDLLPGFCEAFNWIWGPDPVTVLGYSQPKSELPKQFTFISLGPQPAGKDYTTALAEYFSTVRDEYFVLLMDDYFMKRVDHHLLRKAEAIMKADRNVMKFDLTTDRMKFNHIDMDGSEIICSGQGARYRSSLQSAIWRTEYFRKLCVPGRTPWEFELKGEMECMGDGALILGTRSGIIEYDNKCVRGVRV